jgi:hypothetical protein
MYQKYPSGGLSGGNPMMAPVRPAAPAPVLNAVKLMYAGAAVSLVSLIISLTDISGTKAAIRKARPTLTVAQVNQLNGFIIGLAIVSGLVGVGLWLWMSWANKGGKNWARVLSTVLFGLATLDLFGVFSQPKTALGLIFPLVTWLIGLGVIVLLWRPESSQFFKPSVGP